MTCNLRISPVGNQQCSAATGGQKYICSTLTSVIYISKNTIFMNNNWLSHDPPALRAGDWQCNLYKTIVHWNKRLTENYL